MFHTWTTSETVRRQDSSRTLNGDDHPLVVLIDPRTLLGQCTASGLQDVDPAMRYRTCRSLADWLDADCGPTSLLLLCAPSLQLDRDITFLAGRDAQPPFAILSDEADAAAIMGFLQKGARGYVATSQSRTEVCEALRSMLAGTIVVPGAVMAEAATSASPARHRDTPTPSLRVR